MDDGGEKSTKVGKAAERAKQGSGESRKVIKATGSWGEQQEGQSRKDGLQSEESKERQESGGGVASARV